MSIQMTDDIDKQLAALSERLWFPRGEYSLIYTMPTDIKALVHGGGSGGGGGGMTPRDTCLQTVTGLSIGGPNGSRFIPPYKEAHQNSDGTVILTCDAKVYEAWLGANTIKCGGGGFWSKLRRKLRALYWRIHP